MCFMYETKQSLTPTQWAIRGNLEPPSVRRVLAELWTDRFVSRDSGNKYEVKAWHMIELILDLKRQCKLEKIKIRRLEKQHKKLNKTPIMILVQGNKK